MALANSGIINRFSAMAGNFLRAIRKPKMTLEQLSEAVGISTSQLSRFETENRKPRVEEAIKIAKALNVDVADIFPSLGPSSPSETELSDVLNAVRKSYHMLGLDDDEATALLKIVLEHATARKSRAPADESRHRLQSLVNRQADGLKFAEDGET